MSEETFASPYGAHEAPPRAMFQGMRLSAMKQVGIPSRNNRHGRKKVLTPAQAAIVKQGKKIKKGLG